MPHGYHISILLGTSKVVLLDVRQPHEVAEASVSEAEADGRPLVYVPVTLDDSSAMSESFLAENAIAKDQAVLVYCRSGRRAGVAKVALEGLGCSQVINGGAVEDVKAALAAHAKEKARKGMVALLNGTSSHFWNDLKIFKEHLILSKVLIATSIICAFISSLLSTKSSKDHASRISYFHSLRHF